MAKRKSAGGAAKAAGDDFVHFIVREDVDAACCGRTSPLHYTLRAAQVTCPACRQSPAHAQAMQSVRMCRRHEVELLDGQCISCRDEESSYRYRREQLLARQKEHADVTTTYDPGEDQDGGRSDVEPDCPEWGPDPFGDAESFGRPTEVAEAAAAEFREAEKARRLSRMEAPAIFLTSAAAVRAVRKGNARPDVAASVGPGDAWTIMVNPTIERGELGRGRVWQLTPLERSLDAVKKAAIGMGAYRSIYINEPGYGHLGPKAGLLPGPRSAHATSNARGIAPHRLSHEKLMGLSRGEVYMISPGDTLMCSCSRKDAEKGLCHRVWAAALLHRAGWRVILDGREIFSDAEADALLSLGAE